MSLVLVKPARPRKAHKLTPHDYRKIHNVEWSLRLLFEVNPAAFADVADAVEAVMRRELRAWDAGR